MKKVGDCQLTHISMTPEEMDTIIATTNYEAVGDGVMFLDDAQLGDSGDQSGVAARLRDLVGDFSGMIMLSCT